MCPTSRQGIEKYLPPTACFEECPASKVYSLVCVPGIVWDLPEDSVESVRECGLRFKGTRAVLWAPFLNVQSSLGPPGLKEQSQGQQASPPVMPGALQEITSPASQCLVSC